MLIFKYLFACPNTAMTHRHIAKNRIVRSDRTIDAVRSHRDVDIGNNATGMIVRKALHDADIVNVPQRKNDQIAPPQSR